MTRVCHCARFPTLAIHGPPRAYIAGPMRGYAHYNFPAFDAAAAKLRAQGWAVVNPAEEDRAAGIDPAHLPADHDWRGIPAGMDMLETIRRCVNAVLWCDAVVCLPHWSESQGARTEVAVAGWAGKRVTTLRRAAALLHLLKEGA